MDVRRFETSPVGRLVPVGGHDPRFNEEYSHFAFIPDALPSIVDLDNATWASVADAMLMLGRLDDATSRFPNPQLLVRPALRREAVSTSALEGTFTDLEEVLAADVEQTSDLPPDLREVVNAITAVEFGVEAIRSGRPLTMHLLGELQDLLIRGTRTETTDTGRVRTTNVFIGREDQRVPETRFVPAPAGDLLEEGFRHLEHWFTTSTIQALVKAALTHYQFETLHPFHDGNGRVGRILMMLQLIDGQVLRHPNLAISTWLEKHDDDYREGLALVSETGDFDPWVRLMVRAVSEQAVHERGRVDRLLGLRDRLVRRVREAPARGLAVQITEDLIGYPFLRVPDVAHRYSVSFEAANRAVARLVEIGVIAQVGERNYSRAFAAPEVISALRS